MAIELLYAAQALEYRRPNTFSDLIEGIFALIRQKVAMLHEDRLLKRDIDHLIEMVQTRVFKVQNGENDDA
jgi:histidine ammonia-lyase